MNCIRGCVQEDTRTYNWTSADNPGPPLLDPTKHEWAREEATLFPIILPSDIKWRDRI